MISLFQPSLTIIIQMITFIKLLNKNMSKLLLNLNKNNIIFIDNKGQAEFQIQTKGGLGTVVTPILFKIITNAKQTVTITPATGVLLSQGLESKRKIKVKFTGNDMEMKKAKLQIRWITLRSDLQLFPQLESILIFHDFYRKCSEKYAEQKVEMTLQSSNEHNIEVVQYNLKVARQSNAFKSEDNHSVNSLYMKNQEGDVFYYVYLQSKGVSEETINILKRKNIKNLKQLKRLNVNQMIQARIALPDIIKLQEVIGK